MAHNLSGTSCITESLETFFHEMDSEQRIISDMDLEDFVEKVIYATSSRLTEGFIDSLEDASSTIESEDSFSSSSCSVTRSPLVHYQGIQQQVC